MTLKTLTATLLGSLGIFLSGIIQAVEPPPPETPTTTIPLSPGQNSLFDELLEQERERDPVAAEILQEDPVEATALVETAEADEHGAVSLKRPVIGTFIQLSRAWADTDVKEWETVLDIVEGAGMDTLIIQWTATETIAYFEPSPEIYTETYPIINRLFEAARERDLKIILGLSYDSEYWKNIDTRNDIRDVYFRVRNTHNLRLQEALLEEFGETPEWTGYYLSEEIDDIHWREPADEEVFYQFLLRGGRIIEERDPDRSISISSFFRKRTAPSTYADNLGDLMNATRIDRLWIQDGVGVEPISSPLLEPYYKALSLQFSNTLPEIGTVVELFETLSAPDETFEAQPALPRRIKRQLEDASLLGGPIVVFSLFDYADPRKGGQQRENYLVIREWNRELSNLPALPLPEGEEDNP